ncbi:hypothetical protein DID78_04845 [Candidatus Marinamargulisbacteria bacterium SCGC AG-343-D04]|nr:hypothetical protein DID78_04845 [Candidatus Marinamargulisbacteria bacterium SCGC AG-343-D04]
MWAFFLNITPDHLSRHGTLEEYIEQKAKCFQNQGAQHFLIYNQNDSIVEDSCQDTLAECVPFSDVDITSEITQLEQCPGKHNHLNVVAALKVAECLGYSIPSCLQHMKNFKALKHRLEFISEIEGRRFYNDSKATNPEATLQALQSFSKKPLLILCGEDKGLDMTECLEAVIKGTQGVIVFGDIAPRIQEECSAMSASFTIAKVQTLSQAIDRSFKLSKPGDIILFSPSSSSQDHFRSFEDRGNQFVTGVAEYAKTLLV